MSQVLGQAVPFEAFRLETESGKPLSTYVGYDLGGGLVWVDVRSAAGAPRSNPIPFGSVAEARAFLADQRGAYQTQSVQLDPQQFAVPVSGFDLPPTVFESAPPQADTPRSPEGRADAKATRAPSVPEAPAPPAAEQGAARPAPLPAVDSVFDKEPGGIDGWKVAEAAAKSAAFGAVVVIGVSVAPIAAIGVLGGLAIGAFFDRYNRARDLGQIDGAATRALAATISSVVPGDPIGFGEAWYGHDAVTGEPMTTSVRSSAAGGVLGGIIVGGASRFGKRQGKVPSQLRSRGSTPDPEQRGAIDRVAEDYHRAVSYSRGVHDPGQSPMSAYDRGNLGDLRGKLAAERVDPAATTDDRLGAVTKHQLDSWLRSLGVVVELKSTAFIDHRTGKLVTPHMFRAGKGREQFEAFERSAMRDRPHDLHVVITAKGEVFTVDNLTGEWRLLRDPQGTWSY